MVIKKINNKGSTNNLTGLVMSILIIMGIFFALFSYWEIDATDAGTSISGQYSGTYGNLTNTLNSTETTINELREDVEDITEAESAFQVAWNGLKGVGTALKVPFAFVEDTQQMIHYIFEPLAILPGWVIRIVAIAILAFVVLLIFRLFKGEAAA